MKIHNAIEIFYYYRLLYRMNIAIYSFILKLIPSIILTVITGFLGK
jgi:hypothetical protein